MNCNLQLSLQPASQRRTADAWFLRGDDPQTWLEAIAESESAHQDLRLWVVPQNINSLAPYGIVIASTGRLNPPARCRPLSLLANRVFIPTDATLSPCLLDEELEKLFEAGWHYVWLPETGLSKTSNNDYLNAADLIEFEPPNHNVWSFAHPGTTVPQRMTSIRVPVPDDIEAWLESGGDDIGDDANSIDDLPPVDGEPSNDVVSQTLRNAAQKGAAGMGALVRFVQSIGGQNQGQRPIHGGQSWTDKIANWSAEKSAALQSKIDDARNQQLNRLMSMLDKDPDKGLRFAIPFADMAHRGLGRGDSNLSESSVNFNWGGLFGGSGKASFWDMNDQHRMLLTKKYRQLAERETNLGRHRRAAYIYAHLLGDLVAAAGALRAGGHYREAAALYQQKLNRKNLAASCLAEGGYVDEAIDLYVELAMYMEAAELATQADMMERARELYELAAERARQSNDYLAAANIWRNQLDDFDKAIEILQAGWPSSAVATDCLLAELEWLAEDGQQESVVRRIEFVESQELDNNAIIKACRVLAQFSTSTTCPELSKSANEACLVIVSRKLLTSLSIEDRGLLEYVANLHPDDRLLRRDCHRFIDQRETATPSPAPYAKKRMADKLEQINEFRLVPDITWLKAIRTGDGIVAVGDDSIGWRVTQASFDGTEVVCSHTISGVPQIPWILLSKLPGTDEVLCRSARQHGLTHVTQTGTVSSLRLSDGWHVAQDTIACCLDFDQLWTARPSSESNSLLIEALNAHGTRTGKEINRTTPINDVMPIQMHARSGKIFVTTGDEITLIDHDVIMTDVLPEIATGICGSLPNSVERVVVTYETGAQLIWRNDRFESIRMAEDVIQPVAEFTASGHLVVAGNKRMEVYITNDRRLELLTTETEQIGERPIAVLRGTRPKEFLVVDASGVVRTFSID